MLPPLTGLGSTKTGNSISSHHCLPSNRETYEIYWYTPIFLQKTRDPPVNFRCEARRCTTCPILVTTNTFATTVTGESFKLKLLASNKTTNVIHFIRCRQCGLQYVGETGQYHHSWINNHRFNISHGCIHESPVATNFTSEGHAKANLLVVIIDRYWKKYTILRKIRKSR